ncbi:MAG: DUF362 domain-containing protein [Acidobacteria bacterium]|nr:DUF362 domain-containing protein [Acidobacteriota bacterium]
MRLTRREFHRLTLLAGLSTLGGDGRGGGRAGRGAEGSAVALVKTGDRNYGVHRAVELLGGTDFGGRGVYLKASYNSADPFPASTHPDALRALVGMLLRYGAGRVVLAERSGMGRTRGVMGDLGALELIRELGLGFLPLEEPGVAAWRRVDLPGSHWSRGVEVPAFLDDDGCVVQLCNLKTHRFGGGYSASLKNSIGLLAKYDSEDGHNYMVELHSSDHQDLMIAEANLAYTPRLLVMDASSVFVSGGPEAGEEAHPGVIVASTDRVALDAVGLAILERSGAAVVKGKEGVFDQGQVSRAAELGLGARSAGEIRLVTGDTRSAAYASRLEYILLHSAAST